MAEEPPARPQGVAVRIASWILIGSVSFGLLLPLVDRLLGEWGGPTTGFGEGLLSGVVWGVLMGLLGDPLARWVDRRFPNRRVPPRSGS